MDRIVLHTSRGQRYRKLAVGLVVLAIGTSLLMLGVPRALAWTLIVVGAGYAILVLRSMGEDTERIVIDDSGIRDSILPVGTISWEEVRGARVQQIGSVAVVALELRDPERIIRRLPEMRRFLARKAREAGLPAVYLTLADTEGDPHKVAEAINQRVARRSRSVLE